MEIRGQRRCRACETAWSYYETGSVACPNCGSLRSVGRDAERKQHTDAPAALSLAPFQNRIAEEPLTQYAGELKSVLREYTRKRGFINAGELRTLDDTYLTARTLLHTVDALSHQQSPTTGEELYLLSVYEQLADEQAEQQLPPGSTVPDSLREAWGLAATDAVEAYLSDLRYWMTDTPASETTQIIGQLREHVKRVRALQGDVDPETATTLVETARDIGRSLRGEAADGVETAGNRLAELREAS